MNYTLGRVPIGRVKIGRVRIASKVCMDEALRCVHAGGPARSRALATHPGIQPDGLHPSPAAGSVGMAAWLHRPPHTARAPGRGRKVRLYYPAYYLLCIRPKSPAVLCIIRIFVARSGVRGHRRCVEEL